MMLEFEDIDDARLVSVVNTRIDAAVAVMFKDQMRLATIDAPARMILDLTNVRFIDSSGLGALVAVLKILAPQRRLELMGLGPAVAKVMRLTRMDSVFTIHATDIRAGLPSLAVPATAGASAMTQEINDVP